MLDHGSSRMDKFERICASFFSIQRLTGVHVWYSWGKSDRSTGQISLIGGTRKYESTRDPIMVLFFFFASHMWKQTCSPPYTLQLLQRSLVDSDRGKHVLALESFETRHIDPSQIFTSSLFTSISPPSIDLSYRSYPTFSSTFIRFLSFFFLLSPLFLSPSTEMQMLGWSVGQ